VSAGSIHFDTTVDEARITLSNTGGQPIDWTASDAPLAFRGAPSPFSFEPAAGTLAPGAGVQVVFAIDRSWPAEGPVPARRVTFVAAGTSAAVDVTGVVGRPPVIRGVALPPRSSCVWFHPDGLSWQVMIADESTVVGANVELITPGGTVQSGAMAERGDWYGQVAGDGDGDGMIDAGAHRWTVRATDAFGNVATLTGTTTLSEESIDC
jgi:hypothetical protein